MSDPEDFIEQDGDDLFGDDDAGEQPVKQLSDEDLDSGDNEGRTDRVQDDAMDVDTAPQREARIMDVALGRQTIPMPADGEVCLMIMSLNQEDLLTITDSYFPSP